MSPPDNILRNRRLRKLHSIAGWPDDVRSGDAEALRRKGWTSGDVKPGLPAAPGAAEFAQPGNIGWRPGVGGGKFGGIDLAGRVRR